MERKGRGREGNEIDKAEKGKGKKKKKERKGKEEEKTDLIWEPWICEPHTLEIPTMCKHFAAFLQIYCESEQENRWV